MGDPGAGKKEIANGADVCVPLKSLGLSLGVKRDRDKNINYKLTLIFWTLTKGRPRHTTYFHGADAAIIVGNLKSKASLQKMRSWAESIDEHVGEIPLFFIGTKGNEKPSKNTNLLSKLAKDHNSQYYILPDTEEETLKPILKSIGRHLANFYCE